MSLKQNQVTGNKNTDASFTDVVLALKNNIMRNCNVAELVVITKIQDDKLQATLLTNPQQMIECTKLHDLEVQVNDVVLVIFTSTDFRVNLSKYKNNQVIQPISSQTLHSKMYGVVVGLIYRK